MLEIAQELKQIRFVWFPFNIYGLRKSAVLVSYPRPDLAWLVYRRLGLRLVTVVLSVWLCCEYLVHMIHVEEMKYPYNSSNSFIELLLSL